MVVLYNPVKLFVLLSNGNTAEDIVYCGVSGKSNGTGTRKEINWPEGVEKMSKRKRLAFYTKELKAAEKDVKHSEEKVAAIKRGESKSDLKLYTLTLRFAKERVERAQIGLARIS